MVIVNNLTVCKQGHTLLSSVSCILPPGRITTFIGKSGAGKTTLLKSLVGLIPYDGRIVINDKDLTILTAKQRSEEIGYVFQEFNLFLHMTALQNCIDPLLVRGLSVSQAEEQARAILSEFGMEEYGDKYPQQLSGGQKQRIAIARALCLKPRIIVLDEPTASLDPYNTGKIIDFLKMLAARGVAVAVSSQDMSFVHKIFDRVYYMEDGQILECCEGKNMVSACKTIAQFI